MDISLKALMGSSMGLLFAQVAAAHGVLLQRHVTDEAYNQTVYQPLFMPASNATPRFVVDSALRKRAAVAGGEGTCGPGSPCVNGACCSKLGICGYSPRFCGRENCISNCDARAACGQYAPPGKEKCPLNVCCSEFGFCGTTREFCGKGCDEKGGLCGPAPEPKGKSPSIFRSIGYYESWANARKCDMVSPEDLDLTGLTHVNFAFALFHPTSFEISPMDSNAAKLLTRFTGLRSKKIGLETWISIGGWAFNDPGNNPDSRRAFSDMASTATNRAKFIKSLLGFMANNGFQGADIDWEYPVAEDRGGRAEDKENYVLLLKEMQAAFAGRYGISVTLPASYWYLQHFDLTAMEPFVTWFNLMSYDIHGVWDASNRYTGPYIRAHTNMSEIDEGLALLWRAGVSAGNVVLGLGFYGRSFTLTDPSCTKPGCTFKEGGKAGECTSAAGVLSAAEITRIIDKHRLESIHDEKAAVKWIHWDSDQWVSFDDEETFVAKLRYANDAGLSGSMVWSIDQGAPGKTSSAYVGTNLALGQAGYSQKDVDQVQSYLDAGDTCYTSFCGEDCKPGFTSTSQMRGEVGELGPDSACNDTNKLQSLCCKSGTLMGKCRWSGWRGQGLSCYTGECSPGDTLITMNTNHFDYHPQQHFIEDQTCNGGSQIYCCRGFRPSLQLNKDPELVRPEDLDNNPTSLAKRDARSCVSTGIVTGGTVFAIGMATSGPLGGIAGGIVTSSAVTVYCLIGEAEASAKKLVGWAGPTTRSKSTAIIAIPAGAVLPPLQRKPKAEAKNPTDAGPKMFGRYKAADYDASLGCSLIYKCEYGLGFDQVCDNQRWGLEELVPVHIFHYDKEKPRGTHVRYKDSWLKDKYRHNNWRLSFAERPNNNNDGKRRRCEIDEFPMGSLQEARSSAKQVLRAIDGNENGRQGQDWDFWLSASWAPCSTLLGANPPIAWAVDTSTLSPDDPRRAAGPDKVIAKYGFDSTSGREPCFATFTSANGQISPVPDHGFRVMDEDPLFLKYKWPEQNYHKDPRMLAESDRPTSVNSDLWKRHYIFTPTPRYEAIARATDAEVTPGAVNAG